MDNYPILPLSAHVLIFFNDFTNVRRYLSAMLNCRLCLTCIVTMENEMLYKVPTVVGQLQTQHSSLMHLLN